MAKKKKVNTSHLQKIEAAHQRNEFLQRLKLFCDQVTDPSVFKLIPADKLEEIYKIRNRPIKLDAAAGHKISPAMLKEAKGLLNIFKNNHVYLGVGNAEQLSQYDFITIGITLMLYAHSVKESDYPDAMLVKLKLSPLAAFANGEGYSKAWNEIHNTMNLIAVIYGDIASQLFVIKEELKYEYNGTPGMYTFWNVYTLQPDKIQVMIDGGNRPAYKVGIPFQDPLRMDYISIDATSLNLKSENTLPVYIQSHALNRLSERIDGVIKGFLHLCIYLSLKEPNICRNKKGEWLFEFKLLKHKVGYFVADIIDDKIILRTFLFLTNNGTPEGEKLHQNTGIMKEDKIYLTIDKFSSFVNSDIKNNPHIKDIFMKAGCQSLFKIDKHIYITNTEEKTLANLIETYLNKAA